MSDVSGRDLLGAPRAHILRWYARRCPGSGFRRRLHLRADRRGAGPPRHSHAATHARARSPGLSAVDRKPECGQVLTVAKIELRLGGRLMVRLQTLDLRIGVRVPASQPDIAGASTIAVR